MSDNKALELADAYADATFDQALNKRTEDPEPEKRRKALEAELRRLAAVEAELERIRALPPVAWTLSETLEKKETTTRGHLWFTNPKNSSWTPLYALTPKDPT